MKTGEDWTSFYSREIRMVGSQTPQDTVRLTLKNTVGMADLPLLLVSLITLRNDYKKTKMLTSLNSIF